MGTHDFDPVKPRVCHDRHLPRDLARPQLTTLVNGRAQAVAPILKQWANGTVLSVAFIGGTTAQRDLVKQYAPRWSQHANVRFDFRPSLPAMIRVSFDPSDGAWSYLGVDALEIPANAATLNLGWQDQEVILHEFGHALSLAHEHQNPQGGIRWNEAAVIADLSGPPNYWDEQTIRHNVLDRYAADQVLGTEFDPRSIMLYSFPASWTLDGFSAPWNTDISAGDAAFVGSERMYPPVSAPPVERMRLPLVTARGVKLARGAQAEFDFVAPVGGEYNFMTAGALDVVLSLYQGQQLLRSDDDSGGQRQAHVRATLAAGEYRVVVRCYSETDAGRVRVVAWA